MTRPLISIIVPSYNSAHFVRQALDSAFAQTYRPIEVIVVDDGSTDDTADVLRPYMDRIIYVRQDNRGLAGARNSGLRAASGELIALLDADDVWLEEHLESGYQALASVPDAALVHSEVYYWDAATGERTRRDVPRHSYQGDCYLQLFARNTIIPSTLLFRRACYDLHGGFDESFRRCEDWDFALRMARHYRFAYNDDPRVLYRVHSASLSSNAVKMRESDLVVLRKALGADPALGRRLGRGAVRRKLFGVTFGLGYGYFREGNYREARRFLNQALRERPYSLRALALWWMTWFSPPTVERVLRWKQPPGETQ
jgi:glycosyltransferase involved in cell wall biosynthesis